jgi:hypothetical protein
MYLKKVANFNKFFPTAVYPSALIKHLDALTSCTLAANLSSYFMYYYGSTWLEETWAQAIKYNPTQNLDWL